MDYYWADKPELTTQDIVDLRSDADANGFHSSFIGAGKKLLQAQQKRYYAQGEKMYSEICDTSSPPVCKPQYLGAFPLPFASVYGMCNNYSSAAFMENESNECTQIVDLITDCENTLNPSFYTTRVQVFGGQAQSSDKVTMTVSDVYRLQRSPANEALVEYVNTGSTVVPNSVFNASALSCSNVLKEIAYTVKVSEVIPDASSTVSKSAYLKVDSISALVVVMDQPIIALKGLNGKAMASVQQRFSIKFEKKGT